MERWGTGTTRMIGAARQAGLPAPTFAEDGGGLRVTLRRDPFLPELLARFKERQGQALTSLQAHARSTNAGYREWTGASDRTAALDLSRLVELGILGREGRGRNVSYRLPGIPQRCPAGAREGPPGWENLAFRIPQASCKCRGRPIECILPREKCHLRRRSVMQ
ncbi:hypothetical protein [Deinococcus aestuarii]|uniref:hypothetical protein n=1 Tax=Deinococcus aestuarii TaxID=2774531 RepID=UPI0031B81543